MDLSLVMLTDVMLIKKCISQIAKKIVPKPIGKIKLLIKNMRWKVFFFFSNRKRKPNNTTEAKFALKSRQCPPHVIRN